MTKRASAVKTMTNIESGECRWPIGDPRHDDFHFCGAQQVLGRPYCKHHWDQAFMPSKSRQAQQAPAPVFRIGRAA